MSSNAGPGRWCLPRSLAVWGVFVLCLQVLGCKDSKPQVDRTFRLPEKLLPGHHGSYDLRMKPANVAIDGENYCLRTYNGQLPSPTIEVSKGTARSIRLDLTNDFKAEDLQDVNGTMHDFNLTNLHTHGLHVRPEKTADGKFESDNVLLEVAPGDDAVEYRFDLDESGPHEAGTYWYHAHIHGSTAIQVASGMAGALIVRGPVDELPGIREAEERLFLLEQIPYNDDSVAPSSGDCTESTLSINDFSIVARAKNTLVNGVLHPIITTHRNQVERWRFIHAGISEELTIGLRKAGADGDCDNADSANIQLQQIAADGFTYLAKEAVDVVVLEPGNRADVMVQAPAEEGTYCVLDLGSVAGLQGVPEATKILAYLEVDAQEGSGTMPSDADLASVATAPLDCDAPLTLPQRKMVFAQQKDASGAACEGPTSSTNSQPLYNINCQSFEHHDPPLQLPLHKTEEWLLSSENADHPFHIHVNSFTVCPGGTINGTPITTPHWRDTLFVRKADTATGSGTDAITTAPLRIRTTYEDYAGTFVMHCHKLDHEDKGMMQQVQIQ